MQVFLYGFLTAFVVTYVAIPSIIGVAKVKHLYDVPSGRKTHKSSVPTLGGLAIFAGFIFSYTFWSAEIVFPARPYILSAVIILFFIGIKDDLIDISPLKKLIGQFAAASILVFYANCRIQSFYGILGIHELSYVASAAFSILTILIIVNAYNLIDGIDGLAGGIGVISASVFGVYFILNHQYGEALMAFVLVGSLVAFLKFNFSPAKIFMGDTGSLVVGFILAYLAITFIQGSSNSIVAINTDSNRPAIAVSILFIPLYDTLRVIIIRLIKKNSPFSPDNNHIHHSLIDMGLSHMQVCIVLYIVNISFIFFTFSLQNLGGAELLLFVFIGAVLLSFLTYFVKRWYKSYWVSHHTE